MKTPDVFFTCPVYCLVILICFLVRIIVEIHKTVRAVNFCPGFSGSSVILTLAVTL